jgi:hypothetical protein
LLIALVPFSVVTFPRAIVGGSLRGEWNSRLVRRSVDRPLGRSFRYRFSVAPVSLDFPEDGSFAL